MSITSITYDAFRADIAVVINKVGVPREEPEVLNFHPQADFVLTYDRLYAHHRATKDVNGSATVPDDIAGTLERFMTEHRLRDPIIPPEE